MACSFGLDARLKSFFHVLRSEGINININWASIGNTILVIAGINSAFLVTINHPLWAVGMTAIGAIGKAICSEIGNQQTQVVVEKVVATAAEAPAPVVVVKA